MDKKDLSETDIRTKFITPRHLENPEHIPDFQGFLTQ